MIGKGGGREYDNAIWLQRLVERYGPERGTSLYDDLRHKNDEDAPTTSSVRAPYGGGDVRPRRGIRFGRREADLTGRSLRDTRGQPRAAT